MQTYTKGLATSKPTCSLFRSPSNCWNPSNKATKFAGALELVTVRVWITRFLSTNVFKRSENWLRQSVSLSSLYSVIRISKTNEPLLLSGDKRRWLFLSHAPIENSPLLAWKTELGSIYQAAICLKRTRRKKNTSLFARKAVCASGTSWATSAVDCAGIVGVALNCLMSY